jgi:hypothetical protein
VFPLNTHTIHPYPPMKLAAPIVQVSSQNDFLANGTKAILHTNFFFNLIFFPFLFLFLLEKFSLDLLVSFP